MLSDDEESRLTPSYDPATKLMGWRRIRDEELLDGNYFYTLGYPNREVYQSLNNSLLKHLVQDGGG